MTLKERHSITLEAPFSDIFCLLQWNLVSYFCFWVRKLPLVKSWTHVFVFIQLIRISIITTHKSRDRLLLQCNKVMVKTYIIVCLPIHSFIHSFKEMPGTLFLLHQHRQPHVSYLAFKNEIKYGHPNYSSALACMTCIEQLHSCSECNFDENVLITDCCNHGIVFQITLSHGRDLCHPYPKFCL